MSVPADVDEPLDRRPTVKVRWALVARGSWCPVPAAAREGIPCGRPPRSGRRRRTTVIAASGAERGIAREEQPCRTVPTATNSGARYASPREGVSYQQALQRLRSNAGGPGPDGVSASHMAEILRLAKRAADLLGHGRVLTPEHVLLALIWHSTGPVDVLQKLGATERLDTCVSELITLSDYQFDKDRMAMMMHQVRWYVDTHGGEQVDSVHVLAAMTHLRDGAIAQALDELEVRHAMRDGLASPSAIRARRRSSPRRTRRTARSSARRSISAAARRRSAGCSCRPRSA